MKWWEEEYALEDDLEEEMIMVGRVQGEAVVSTAPCTLPTLLLPIPPHALPTLPQPMRPEGRQPTMQIAPEAPVGLDKWCQAPHPVARAWPSGDSEAPAPDWLGGMAEVFSMTAPDGEVLMGAAAVGPDVGSLGLRLDGSVRDDCLRCMQRTHHGEALRRLGLGETERRADTHMPVEAGGGLRPPQDRPPPTAQARLGLPLLRR